MLGLESVYRYTYTRGDEIVIKTPVAGVLDLNEYIVVKRMHSTIAGVQAPLVLQKTDGSKLIEFTYHESQRHFSLYDIRDLELIKANHV